MRQSLYGPFLIPLPPKVHFLLMPKALDSIRQLSCYSDFLQIQNNFPPCYVHMLLSFSMKMEDFMENLHLMFADMHANLYKRPLQVAQFTYLGWLLGRFVYSYPRNTPSRDHPKSCHVAHPHS